jgi:hypothetical protein
MCICQNTILFLHVCQEPMQPVQLTIIVLFWLTRLYVCISLLPLLLLLLLLQPLDKLERVELRKQAEQFVEPGFKLVMQVRSSGHAAHTAAAARKHVQQGSASTNTQTKVDMQHASIACHPSTVLIT